MPRLPIAIRRRSTIRSSPSARPTRHHRPRRRGPTPPSEYPAMSVINSIRAQFVPIHREGYPFVGGFALASLVLFLLWSPLGWLGTLVTAWCAYFFRDPPRVTPIADGLVVAPADGRVSQVTNAVPTVDLALGAAA